MDRVDLLQEIADLAEQPKCNDDEWGRLLNLAPPHTPSEVKRGKLRFMIGLQRSGKSTWATRWMRGKPREENGIVFPRAVVCADNIRLAITGHRYNRRAEPVVFTVKDYMIEALLSRGHDVLVDGTHTTKTSIRRNFEIDLDASWTLINTPVEVCKKRAVESGQPDLVPVLDRTGRQLRSLLDEGLPKVCEEIRKEVRDRWPINTITPK